MDTVDIYTDGACSGNPGPGGWAAILKKGETEKEISGGEAVTFRRRGRDDKQPHGADRCDHGSCGAQASLRGESLQ